MSHVEAGRPSGRRANLVAALVVPLLAAVLGCNGLFYFPSRGIHSVPREPREDVLLRTSDGVRLHGWYFPPASRERPVGTFIQFHGNAGNVTSHYRALSWVIEEQWALFTFDYRGYGRSTGTPTREGLNHDAVAALKWAIDQAPRGSGAPDIVLYGQSLGGAVLLRALDDVKNRRRIRAVVIESSFHSYEEIAASVLYRHPLLAPLTGLGYALVTEDYGPAASIGRVSPIPLLVIHDVFDPVVPATFGAAIHRLAREPKTLWVTHRGGHIRATADHDLRSALLEWLERPPQQVRGRK